MPRSDFQISELQADTDRRAGQPNQIVDAEIKQSMDSQLVLEGFKKVDSDEADLLVGYQIAVNSERQCNANGMGDGLPWPEMRTRTASATSSTIEIENLVLDVYDPAAKRAKAVPKRPSFIANS